MSKIKTLTDKNGNIYHIVPDTIENSDGSASAMLPSGLRGDQNFLATEKYVKDEVDFGVYQQYKKIYLSIWKEKANGYLTRYIRLNLINFTKNDIGKKIFLYRLPAHYRRNATSHIEYVVMRLKHPRNYLDAAPNWISYFGYACMIGQKNKIGSSIVTYPDISEYHNDNGAAQTEWSLTSEDIERKYIDINASEFLVNFICPRNPGDAWESDVALMFAKNTNQCSEYHSFFVCFALEKEFLTMSDRAYFSTTRAWINSSYTIDQVVFEQNSGRYALKPDFFKLVIKK